MPIRVLRAHRILRDAPTPVLRSLASQAIRRRVQVGQLLCGPSEPQGRVWFVGSGMLHATVHSGAGTPVTIDLLQGGDAFGYLNCWMDGPHEEDVHALLDSDVVGVPADKFMSFIEADHEAGVRLLRETAERTRLLVRLRAISTEPAPERVRSVLKLLQERVGRTIPMTRVMIGMVAGLTTETVSRAMAPLHRRRIVALRRGSVEILDPSRL